MCHVSLNSTHCTNAASQVFLTALLTALLTAARLECDEDAAEKKSYINLFVAGHYDVWVLCFELQQSCNIAATALLHLRVLCFTSLLLSLLLSLLQRA